MADLRIATYNVGLSREGPGLLLRDILAGAEDVAATQAVIARVAPDILLLTDFDYDAGQAALAAYATGLARGGAAYPVRFALRPNSGRQAGLDLDGDGRRGEPEDALGFGRFAGQGGMAILSRHPITGFQDFSDAPWSGFDWATLPEGLPDAARLPLASVAHWEIGIATDAGPLTLWALHATPPVFDGPEDRNGLRNRDQHRFWERRLTGYDGPPAILLGDFNLDPVDGDGRPDALTALLNHPALQDPRPASLGGVAAAKRDGGVNLRHRGDPALDTADWRDEGTGPGNLRVDYVLPSRDFRVTGSGVFWPAPDAPDAALLGDDGSRHRLVWVDLVIER